MIRALFVLLLSVTFGFGAVHTNYVDTASTAGGDGTTTNLTGSTRAYASLLEAVNAIGTEAGGGELARAHVIICRATTGLADTQGVVQANWTMETTPDNYILITVAPGHRHGGRVDFTKYRLEVTDNHIIYNSIPGHVRVEWLQGIFRTVAASGAQWEIFRLSTQGVGEGRSDNDVRISHCIAMDAGGSGTAYANGFMNSDFADGASGTVRIWNNIAIGCNTGFQTAGTQTKLHWNNTAVGCDYGFINAMAATNNLAAFSITKSFESIGTGDYNASDDANAVGANGRINQTFTFVNTNTGDYRLDIADAGARNFGFNNPGNGFFSTDIEGQARSNAFDGAWDIGFDEAYYMLPRTNRIDWSLAGVPGLDTIRASRTVYTNLTSDHVDTNGLLDAIFPILVAYTNCPSNGIVVLPAGRIVLSNSIDVQNYKTIRGATVGETVLIRGQDNSAPLIRGGNEEGRGASNMITFSGLFKGATNIAVRDTPDFTVGTTIVLYRENESATNFSLTFHNSTLTNSWITTNTVGEFTYYSGDGSWYYLRSSDVLQQYVRVTAISGTNVSFWPPLHYAWTNEVGLTAYCKALTGRADYIGFENLTLTNRNTQTKMVSLANGYGTWFKNCKFQGIVDSLFYLTESLNCEIRDSDFENNSTNGVPGGDTMGITLVATHSTKIENNSFAGFWSPIMMNNSDSGNFIAYNYYTNGWHVDSIAGRAAQPDIMANHVPHCMMNLFEGNILAGFHSDNYHGSSSHGAIFRNNIHGMSHSFGYDLTNRIRAIDLCRYSRYWSVVGNVLLSPEAARAGSFYIAPTNGGFDATTPAVYRLGFPDTGNDGFGDAVYITYNGSSGTTVYGYPIRYDAAVSNTLHRLNNYDFVNDAIPDGSTNIPSSWVYSETPVFLTSYTYPPANPNAGTMALIPSQERFNGSIPAIAYVTKSRSSGKANGDRPMMRNVGKTITR